MREKTRAAVTTPIRVEADDAHVAASGANGRPDDDSRHSVPIQQFVDEIRRRLRLRFIFLAFIFVTLAIGGVAVASWEPVSDRDWLGTPIRQFSVGLLVAAVGAVVIPLFLPSRGIQDVLFRFLRDEIREELGRLSAKIEEQTEKLYGAVASLGALQQLSIARVYPSRGDADLDMEQDLQGARSIRLLGVSLDDLLHPGAPFQRTWRLLEGMLRTGSADIKFLLVHPDSLGAQLRSEAETDEERSEVEGDGRASEEVSTSALRQNVKWALASLRAARANVRLYRSAPQLFLVQTDRLSYAQPYHFWHKRDSCTSLPLVRCVGGDLHESLRKHFDILWERASVSADDYLGFAPGVDNGAARTGIANVFADPFQAGRRMEREIDIVEAAKGPEGRVWLEGHSLDSYFDSGYNIPLFGAVKRAILAGADVRVLVLDPDCEQARYRSYRESQLSGGKLKFEPYVESGLHAESPLVSDTKKTIAAVRRLNDEGYANVEIRLYKTAPVCFLLLTSELAMVEQYHYGERPVRTRRSAPYILGKDMPVLEYRPTLTGPRAWTRDAEQFRILESHFEFAWAEARRA